MATVTFEHVWKRFGDFAAVKDLNLGDHTTASSWSSSVPPAAARPRACG